MRQSLPSAKIYVYTTESYKSKNYVKVGQTERNVIERISEQFGTSNAEQPILLWTAELSLGKSDHHIHHQLEANGVLRVSQSVGREWFVATIEQVKKAFNQVCFGSDRGESYNLRPEQFAAVSKARKWFAGEYDSTVLEGASHKNRFLLNAKMRFGKCFTGIHIARAIDAINTLIITYKPEVISEWMSAVNDHVHFEGWTGIRARQNSTNLNDLYIHDNGDFPMHKKQKIVCVSLQDLRVESDGTTKPRLKNLLKLKWDLIIFDEVHFGSRTERARFIIDSLKWSKRLDLSGTPFRLIQEEDFCPQQVYTYSYLDEQKNKIEEGERTNIPICNGNFVYQGMPDLDVSTIEITDEDINQQRETFLTDDLDFSLNELFRVSSQKFVHRDAVDHFIEGLCKRTHDARAISVFGKLGDGLGVPKKRHTVWWLNRVESVRALSKKLKSHPYFGNFEIINASGCEETEDDEQEGNLVVRDKKVVQDCIQRVHNDANKFGTITLTVRRFLTGVTIKEWDSILILNDVSAAESYFQAIFRVQSAWVEGAAPNVSIVKPIAWVFDFAVSRCLRLTFHYADALADQLDQQDSSDQIRKDNLQEVTEGLCERLNIKRFLEGNLKSDKTTSKDIFEAINFSGSRLSLAKRITSDALVSFVSLAFLEEYPELFEALKRVKGYRTQEVGGIEDFLKIGKDAIEKAKNDKKESSEEDNELKNKDEVESEVDKEKQSRKKWYATQIKRLAICIADFIYTTQFREHKIDHVIETKDSEFFYIVTGITKDEFVALCDLGFIRKESLNRIVREFRCHEESSLSPEEFVMAYISTAA